MNLLNFAVCFILLAYVREERFGANARSSSRETLVSGVCDGVNRTTYQNFVKYNPGKSYYRDGDIRGIYQLNIGSSLANCSKLCGLDWETSGGQPITLLPGDPDNPVDGTFTTSQECEAFVFNPETDKCILIGGNGPLSLRESSRYYSGYMMCPEPSPSIVQPRVAPPPSVTVSAITVGTCDQGNIQLTWESAGTVDGYFINCFQTGMGTFLQYYTSTLTYVVSLPLGIEYHCYVSAFSYYGISEGTWTSPQNIVVVNQNNVCVLQ